MVISLEKQEQQRREIVDDCLHNIAHETGSDCGFSFLTMLLFKFVTEFGRCSFNVATFGSSQMRLYCISGSKSLHIIVYLW